MSAPLPDSMKTVPSLEDVIRGETRTVKKKNAVIASAQDIHGNMAYFRDIINKGLEIEEHVVAVLGDAFDHKLRPQVYQALGIHPDSRMIEQGYIMEKLEDDADKDIFGIGAAVDMHGGLEQYISLLKMQYQSVTDEQINDQIVKNYEIFQSEEFKDKVRSQITEEDMQMVGAAMQENQLKMQILDQLIVEYEAKQIADVMNEYKGKLTVVNEFGNHCTAIEHKAIEKYLDDPSMLISYLNLRGPIKAGGLTVAVGSNTYGISNPSDNAAYGPEIADKINPHMQLVGVMKDFKKAQLKLLTKANVANSPGYITNTNGGAEDEELDAIIIHSELGTPLGYEDGKSRYEKFDDIGLLYLATKRLKEGGKVYAGHLHSDAEGVNELGILTKRTRGVVLSKKNGSVIEHMVETPNKSNYDPIPYPLEEFNEKLEEQYQLVLEEMHKQYQQAA